MGLEEVELDIRRRIESKVSTIKNSAEKEAEQIIADARDKIRKLKEAREKEVKNMIKEQRDRELASANLQVRKLKLMAKQEVLDSVYKKVREKISNLKENEKRDIFGNLVEMAKKEVPDLKYASSNEADKKLAAEITRRAGLEYKGTIDCLGGIVFENKDCSVRVDYTFDMILEKTSEKSLKDIAQILFKV